jgi:hypothetical protein
MLAQKMTLVTLCRVPIFCFSYFANGFSLIRNSTFFNGLIFATQNQGE